MNLKIDLSLPTNSFRMVLRKEFITTTCGAEKRKVNFVIIFLSLAIELRDDALCRAFDARNVSM